MEAKELLVDGAGERLVVRPNGVDVGDIGAVDRDNFRAEVGIPVGAALALSLGRTTAKKGLGDMIRGVAKMPRIWAAIVGPDSRDGTLAELLSLAESLDARERIRIVPTGFW